MRFVDERSERGGLDSGAKSAAAENYNKFPTAHSVAIDEASDFDAAPEFKAAFESALRNNRIEDYRNRRPRTSSLRSG